MGSQGAAPGKTMCNAITFFISRAFSWKSPYDDAPSSSSSAAAAASDALPSLVFRCDKLQVINLFSFWLEVLSLSFFLKKSAQAKKGGKHCSSKFCKKRDLNCTKVDLFYYWFMQK